MQRVVVVGGGVLGMMHAVAARLRGIRHRGHRWCTSSASQPRAAPRSATSG